MNEYGQTVQYAYVDESGDPDLDLTKQGTSSFYVVTAVLVDENSNADLIAQVDSIRRKFFSSGEMKSSGIGNKVGRRRRLLTALVGTGIRFYAVVIDKSQLDPNSGYQYRRSFVKKLHSRLYRQLYRTFTSLHVLADEHGRSEFMKSFKRYLEKNYQKDLWDQEDFKFAPSHDAPLIQAADVIGGSLRRIYSGDDPTELRKILRNAEVFVERWPPSMEHPDIVTGLEGAERFDHLVAQQGIMLTCDFIDKHASSDVPDTEAQVDALQFLLDRYELEPTSYIHAQPILDHVNSCREEPMPLQSFRTNVIGKLRSDGVIIASSNKGYKIPNTTADIADFVSLVDGQTIPYLKRLAQARRQLRLASQGDYDIVSPQEYPELSKCLLNLEADGE